MACLWTGCVIFSTYLTCRVDEGWTNPWISGQEFLFGKLFAYSALCDRGIVRCVLARYRVERYVREEVFFFFQIPRNNFVASGFNRIIRRRGSSETHRKSVAYLACQREVEHETIHSRHFNSVATTPLLKRTPLCALFFQRRDRRSILLRQFWAGSPIIE